MVRRARRMAATGVATVAAVAVCVFGVALVLHGPQRVALSSEPFDSNLPIQWDSSASVDLDGLSRYYSAASAHLRNGAPKGHMALKMVKPAREMSLAELPTQQLGQDKDWDEAKWSPEHYINVAGSRVDDITANGIWKNKDEAWDGIDNVLPTDTRYEYQTMHSGHGQEAKMEAFLDHAHHQLKVLKEALPKLAADKDSKKELDTLKGVISVGEDALEKIERDTVIDDAQSRHEKVKDELSDEELGLSDKFKVFKGNQLRQKASASQHGVGLLDVQPDSVLNIDSSDEAVWAPGGDPFKSIGQPSFHSRSAQHPAAARAHYENSQAAMSEMDSYFASLNRKTQQENRKNARRAGEGVGEVHERDQRALDHSTQKLRLGKGMQQLKAAAPSKHQQALRFIKALSSVLSPQQLQQLKSSSDSCGMCIAVMGCEDCCELFCTDEQNSAASTNKIPKCPLSGGDAGGDSGCDDSEVAATSDVSKLEGDMKDLKKQLKVTSELDQAQHAALEAEIKDVSTHITSALQSAKGTAAATKSARAAPCDCTTQECKECPESDYDARARYSAAQEKQRLDKEYPAADAQKFKILFKKAVQEAGIAAVKEAVKEEKTQEQSKVEEAVKKEMKALKAQMTKTKRMPCECDSADCGNCPDKHVEARKGKAGGRGRAAASRGAKAVDPDKVAKAAAENRALKKAELAVAKSNAILQERVAALEATNAIAIRQGLGVYGDLSGDDSEWKAREPSPGKSETLGKTVSQPIMDLEKQLLGARREVKALKSKLQLGVTAVKKGAKEQHKREYYVRKGKADDDMLPYYEQPAYGGRATAKAVREFRKEVANGVAAPY